MGHRDMRHRIIRHRIICSSLAAALLAVWAAMPSRVLAEDPQLVVEVVPDRIYLGESARYRVTLQKSTTAVEPKLQGFDDFTVRSLGGGSQMRMSITINGVTRSSGGYTYEYVLTPKRAGALTVPGPVVEIDGKTYQGPEKSLRVDEPEKQDLAVLEMTANRKHVYPLQSFTVKLNVSVKALPTPNEEVEPVSVQSQLSRLTIPWADDDQLPDGVEPRQPAGEWLRQLLSGSRRPAGFAINNVGSRSPFPDMEDLLSGGGFPGGFGDLDSAFSLLREDRRAAFHPQPRRTVRENLRGGRDSYWEYSFERTFTAKNVGELSFGPVSLKGMFASGANTRGELTGERIYAVADAIEIEVRDAPVEGRPDSYVGAIGRFEIGAEIQPTEVKVGDPMTLSIWLQGEGTLDRATAPKLDQDAQLASTFKVHEGSEQTTGDTRRFMYSVRPRRAGIREFPPIPLSYFDVNQEKYVSLTTPALPISVADSHQLVEEDIAMAASGRPGGNAPQARLEGIFANIVDESQLRNDAVRPREWFLSLGGMAAVFLATALITQQVRKRNEDVPGRRRRSAHARARARWHAAQTHVAGNAARPAADAFSQALLGMIADIAGISEQGLTSGDAVQRLRDLDFDFALVDRVADVLEQCDAVRYGAPFKPLPSLGEQSRIVLEDLSRAASGRNFVRNDRKMS